MNSSAALGGAVVQRLLLRVKARIFREQRRVDVENAIRERIDEDRAQQAHESGKADKRDVAVVQFGDERAIVVLTRRVGLVAQHERFDAGGSRVIETRRIGAIRNHDRDRCVELSSLDRVDDRLEVRAAAGDQDAERAIDIQQRQSEHRLERSETATNVSVPLVQPPVGSVGAPMTNRFS